MGQERGEIRQPVDPYAGQGGFMQGMLAEMGTYQPKDIGGRNPLPGWPGDNPGGDGQGGMVPRQLINYQGLPGFSSFQDSFPPGPIAGRRRIDMDPGQYGQGLQYKNPAFLQQMSDSTVARGAQRGRFSGGRFSGGQGFGEGYQGDALRRLLQARLGGGGL